MELLLFTNTTNAKTSTQTDMYDAVRETVVNTYSEVSYTLLSQEKVKI